MNCSVSEMKLFEVNLKVISCATVVIYTLVLVHNPIPTRGTHPPPLQVNPQTQRIIKCHRPPIRLHARISHIYIRARREHALSRQCH